MPVNQLVENNARLLVFHFHDAIRREDVETAIIQLTESADPHITYRSFLVFHGSADLSDIGPAELQTIKSTMNEAYASTAIQRPDGAIVVDGSLDATLIMPLWKAMCDADPGSGVRYRFL